MDTSERRSAFRRLHEEGCFVMPNPWDVGSARLLAGLGFKALATTSGGFAFARGLPDGAVPLDEMLAHTKEIVEATDLPVNADFQRAYADEPEDVATNVRLCVETGVAGLSVEDMTRERELYARGLAVERVRAARAAIDASGPGVLLTARCESFVVSHPHPPREARERLEAFAEAGADVLFAPGTLNREAISAIVAAAGPKPVSVMTPDKDLSVGDLAALGVRRVSLATSLMRAGLGAFMRAAREIAEKGTFGGLEGAEPSATLNRFFRDSAWTST